MMSDMEYNWADCPMCDEKDKRIEELEAENKRLFAAHSTEMVRADKLKGALEFETERANGLGEEVERLEKWKAYHEGISKNRVDLESDLRAEVERLRDVLHEIVGTSYSREVIIDFAKQALEKGDEIRRHQGTA